ncbi:MAG TPA: DUF192 domain-containing protein [Thermoanaerobaculia bacterium]|nr:DUF192 domain-containing protein [Thermoanaerobaculia bacterium]
MKSNQIAIVLLALSIGCAKAPATAPAEQPAATAPAPVASGPRVVFPDGTQISVEIVADDEARAQGLMFRDSLRPNAGMLFFFPKEGDYPFWMKNTFIPLDMIWIDSTRHVVAIHHDVPPCKADPCASYPPNANALYVLEVAAGVAQQHALKVGDVVRYESMPDVTAR